jgi:hypothetical protein
MSNGRLPALATLEIGNFHWQLYAEGEGVEEGCRLGRAFEAVAGTLRRLTLTGVFTGAREVACYEVGAAIGKLRRLRYLELSLYTSGRNYHTLGQGLAASGGCPELFEIRLTEIHWEAELLIYHPSLIAPSVRALWIDASDNEVGLMLFCCGLTHTGYKYRVDFSFSSPSTGYPICWNSDLFKAIVRAGALDAE